MVRKGKSVRVRYAPSPTGIPHVGNIRTALFDYFLAKKTNGQFILRLEDTDQARKIEGAEEAIKESLIWLGADWDEYVVQSERLGEYKKYAEELVGKGLAKEEDGAIRFIVLKDRKISWTDAVGDRGIEFESNEVEDFIILKKDGYPTYHLANVVDDHLMNITHVIRGDDWISSTPKHILLYEAFGWEAPIFAHVPNVMGTDGKKLSKRRGAKSVIEFRKEGYLPEALLNYLMLLGWSPDDDEVTILSKEEIADQFSLAKISVSPAIFDERKLEWMNGEYIRKTHNSELKTQILEFDKSLKEFDDELLTNLITPAKSRMKTLKDFKKLVLPFMEKAELNKSEVREKFKNTLSEINDWNKDVIVEKMKKFVNDEDIKFQDLYELTIGAKQGLPLGDVFEILGKDRTLSLIS